MLHIKPDSDIDEREKKQISGPKERLLKAIVQTRKMDNGLVTISYRVIGNRQYLLEIDNLLGIDNS